MVTKDVQTFNVKFDHVMFTSLVLMWERNFEVTFGVFSVLVFQITVPKSYLVFQITVLKSYLDIYLF